MESFFAEHFSFINSAEGWVALVTLVAMEIVLGIDNLIFISILSNKLPEADRSRARRLGIGAALMRHAMAEAKMLGHAANILVGDAPYYARFGFTGGLVADLHLPGPVERARLLGIELIPGALDGAEGLVAGCGRLEAAERQAA